MIDIYITYNKKSQIENFKDLKDDCLTYHLIDSLSKKGKRESWSLKSHWGAKLDPFVIIMEGDNPIKAFYSEAQDVINDLILYLKENESKLRYKESGE